jgi:hypothetical protein
MLDIMGLFISLSNLNQSHAKSKNIIPDLGCQLNSTKDEHDHLILEEISILIRNQQ